MNLSGRKHVFKNLKTSISQIFRGIRTALEPRKELPPPPEKTHPKDRKRGRRKQRAARSGDGTYVRAADRRDVPQKGVRPEKVKSESVPKVPRSRAKAPAAPKVREALPMPELAPPPAEEGKTRFFDLDLAPEVLAATQTLGFKYCTPIQEKCLPHAISGRDMAAKAQTGTGKTAAFLASVITRLLRKPKADAKPGTQHPKHV